MNTLFDLTGRKAIVTGAAQGLAYSMAEGLMESGAEVAVIDISDRTVEVAREFCGRGFRCHGYRPICPGSTSWKTFSAGRWTPWAGWISSSTGRESSGGTGARNFPPRSGICDQREPEFRVETVPAGGAAFSGK